MLPVELIAPRELMTDGKNRAKILDWFCSLGIAAEQSSAYLQAWARLAQASGQGIVLFYMMSRFAG